MVDAGEEVECFLGAAGFEINGSNATREVIAENAVAGTRQVCITDARQSNKGIIATAIHAGGVAGERLHALDSTGTGIDHGELTNPRLQQKELVGMDPR
jgi:hypothetical protein